MNALTRQKARVVRWLYEWRRRLYYHFAFGKDNALSRRWATSVTAWERERRKGDVPVEQRIWEEQYSGGKWEFLGGLTEVARYSVIAGYIAYLKTNPAILDVGCGEGILFHRYRSLGYTNYTGIDLSAAALAGLRAYEDDRTHFLQVDAEHFDPEAACAACFDVAVFNESLYYFNEPLAAVRRYAKDLKADGLFIISTYLPSRRAVAILNQVKDEYQLLDETQVTNGRAHGRQASTISVFSASRQQPWSGSQ